MRMKYFMGSVLFLSLIFANVQIKASMTGKQYKNIIGRGWSCGPQTPFTPYDMEQLKLGGFDNIRIRTNQNDYYTDEHFNWMAEIVDMALDYKIVPIIAWNHKTAEYTATEAERLAYIDWWSRLATKMADKSDSLAFDLFIELTKGTPIRENINVYKSWSQGAIDAIRAVSPTRIIILAAPGKKSASLYDIPPELYKNDDYMMAEWHLWAGGMNHKGGQSNWEGDGSESDRQNVIDVINLALDWTAETGIETWFGAWMPYSQNGLITQHEAVTFSEFFVEQLTIAKIPWTVNGKYYSVNEDMWFETITKCDDEEVPNCTDYNMKIITEIITTNGNFLWGTSSELNNSKVENDSKLQVYPNPTTNNINVIINDNSFNSGRFQIINESGTILACNYFSGKLLKIDFQDYDPGIYFVDITYNNFRTTSKIIKDCF